MSEKRRGLGRGLGALIPSGPEGARTGRERPVDVYFPGADTPEATQARNVAQAAEAARISDASVSGVPPTTATDLLAPSAVGSTGANETPAQRGGGLVPVPGAAFAELSVTDIRPNPRQPRTVFDEDALDELVGSIREVGVLQPIVVRQVGDGYELIMGERRLRAAQGAGLDRIPAIIRETGDADLLRDALLENLHRAQLNPLEEAAAYRQLLDDFGCTHDELAGRLHRSRPQISNTLRLLKLPPLVQRRVAAGVLSAGHARALLALADPAGVERLAQRIVAEGLSVRAVEEIVTLGGQGAAPTKRATPRAGVRNEALDALAQRLADRLDTRVTVALGKRKGRLTVEFASVQDLNRILATLAPEDPGVLRR